MSAPEFAVDIYQNEYLPAGAREVNAIVTVTSAGSVAGEHQAVVDAAEIIIVDCSGSMGGARITQAREATVAAIDAIRDGVAFAIIEGTDGASVVYPPRGSPMCPADDQARQAAKAAVGRLRASGGTDIGEWLRRAHQLFLAKPDALRHAILLTDGKDGGSSRRLAAAVALCEGVFRCDCRGVGTDWKVDELRKISTALLGTVDIVPDPAGLAADFESMMQASMAKQVADVALRVWTPQHAAIRFVKQVAPTVEDMTARRTQVTPQQGDYPTGAWGAGEGRDYHVCVDVQPGAVGGPEMLAARISLMYAAADGPQTLGRGNVRAIWTDDDALSTTISRQVAHYTGQAELAQAIQDGLEARKKGDDATARARLGRAVALAHESGNTATAGLLASVVDVVDPATGVVTLKARVAVADEMALDTRSSKTVRVKK